MELMKAVFHINEPDKWNMVLANVNNLIKDVGENNVVIEVIANGTAVSSYFYNYSSEKENIKNGQDKELIDKMSTLAKVGVKFIACRNSLNAQGLREDVLPSFVEVIQAAITELILKQMQGYAYIKP